MQHRPLPCPTCDGTYTYRKAKTCLSCFRSKAEPLSRRLLARITIGDGCWLWTGATQKGYGVLRRGRRGEGLIAAHRAAFETLVGPIPLGLELDHLCSTRLCVNPGHLEPVTHRENIQRWWRSKVPA